MGICLAVGDAVAGRPVGTRLGFHVCFEDRSWRRPSAAEHISLLNAQRRYRKMTPARLRQVPYWTRDVLVFTSYGLSARHDQLNLSGLWSLEDPKDAFFTRCYDHGGAQRLGEERVAEAWLIGYRARELRWRAKRYVLVVERVQR